MVKRSPNHPNVVVFFTDQQRREVSEAMKERLIRRMSEAGEREANIEPAPTRPGGERRVLLEETRA